MDPSESVYGLVEYHSKLGAHKGQCTNALPALSLVPFTMRFAPGSLEFAPPVWPVAQASASFATRPLSAEAAGSVALKVPTRVSVAQGIYVSPRTTKNA